MILDSVPAKLAALRALMQKKKMDAYIVMSADPHMSEYLPHYWQTRAWLSGFSGSVGTLVVTADFAGLWVDGRYWVQAEQQLLGSGFVLQKLTAKSESTHVAWLVNHLPENACIGVDGQALSVANGQALLTAVKRKNMHVVMDADLISSLWLDREALPCAPIIAMKKGLNAKSRAEKLTIMRTILCEKQVTAHFISSLDDIAWLLNCRGADVAFNPVFLAHILLTESMCILFVDTHKISQTLQIELAKDGVAILDYAACADYLATLADERILLDANKVSVKHWQTFSSNIQIEWGVNPSTLLKSCKAEGEIDHIKVAMKKDGVALVQFLMWLEQAIAMNSPITELTIAEKLLAYRSLQANFLGESFSTIAGFNANGALPHYRATEKNHATIQKNGLLLIDSGAQYEEGTTDITRMIAVGELSPQQRKDCSLVLKAHIALARAIFPEGIAAPLLDGICRQALWQEQLDYRHGTGHGVGFALNVHEGPQVLSYYAPITEHSSMRAGMVTSNEPGLYHEGQYGIRIENLVVNRLLPSQNSYGDFLFFETLTLCPISTTCLDVSLLNEAEKQWLNEYHQMVYQQLVDALTPDEQNWLKTATAAI